MTDTSSIHTHEDVEQAIGNAVQAFQDQIALFLGAEYVLGFAVMADSPELKGAFMATNCEDPSPLLLQVAQQFNNGEAEAVNMESKLILPKYN